MKMSVFMIDRKYEGTKAFTNFTDARAQAIKMLKERKREGELIISFAEKVCPIDYDRSIHKITMTVKYERVSWENRRYWATKHYSITIKCYGEFRSGLTDPIFNRN